MSDAVTITVDGHELTVPPGRTLAAALTLEDGRPGWRATRRTEGRRGLFCGIGACFDCLAEVDGRPGMRTCMVTVHAGMQVRTGALTDGASAPVGDAGQADEHAC